MELPVCVISICNGIAIPLVALQHALSDIALTFPEVKYQINHTIIVEIDNQANQIASEIMKAHDYPGNITWIQDVKDLDQWCIDNVISQKLFATADYIIIVLSGTPCKSISYGCKHTKSRTQFGLHANPSKLWFSAHAAIYELCKMFPIRNRVIFIENVVPANKDDLNELDIMAGHRSDMHTVGMDGITRNRYAWTSLKLSNAPVTCSEFENTSIPQNFHVQTNRPVPTLRAIFPRLFWKHAEAPDTVSDQDKQTISDCYVLDKVTGMPTMPPLELWCSFMGFDAITSTVLTNTLPCKKVFHFFDDVGPVTRPCGQGAYCSNCSEKLTHLGEAWNLSTTCKKLTHLIRDFTWAHRLERGRQDLDLFTYLSFQYDFQPHSCPVHCRLIRSKLH